MPELLTLASGDSPPLALDLLKTLACAGFVAVVLGRLRISAIPGYLIAGALIGPYAFGLLGTVENIESIADLAVILLMFGIGLHLDTAGLRRGAVSLVSVGVVSTLLTAGLGTPIGMLFGLSAPAALTVAMAISMSSTAVVLKLIQQRRELHRAYGRLSFGVLLMQDILVIGMLALIPTLAEAAGAAPRESGHAADPHSFVQILGGAGLRIGGLTLLLVVGKYLLPRAMFAASKTGNPEVTLVVAAAAALGAAAVCDQLGLSPELGAFIAGFLLASTPFRFQVSGQISPLRDLFMATFFTAVGMKLDLLVVAPLWWVVLLGLVVMLALKTAVIGFTSWAAGATGPASLRVGLGLSQAGEFSLVLLSLAVGRGLLNDEEGSLAIAVVVGSLIVTPVLFNSAERLGGKMQRVRVAPWVRSSALTDRPAQVLTGDEAELDESEPSKPEARLTRYPVIVAGYGPVGRAVADQLEGAGVPVTIVELNTRTVRRQMELGRSIVFGDITNAEVLESAGIHEAEAVVMTVPDEDAMLRACKTVRSISSSVLLVVRAGVVSKAMLARDLGADDVVVEELAAATQMSEKVLRRLQERIERAEGKKRESVKPDPGADPG